VKSASLTRFAPISGGSGTNLDIVISREGASPIIARNTWVNNVGPKYFATMGIPVLSGREFAGQDSDYASPVAIVNQAFAQRYFGNASPIGKTINLRGAAVEIVGVVGNAKYSEIRETIEPTVYRHVFQQFGEPIQVLIRTELKPESVAASVRAEARSVIGTVSIRERTLDDHINATIVRERLVTRLAAFFGGFALVLAVIGLYGVVSNSVARRTKEIGIRIALGFERRSAVSMVLHEVFVLVGAGIILGLPMAFLLTRSLDGLLYGLAPDDPVNVVAAVAALLLSALAAAFIPARRAASVDPMVVLRNE
jgi:predicted permease